VTYKLYVEGGGEGPRLDTRFREAWQRFFHRAGLAGRMPKVVRGGGRSQTFEMFRTALANPRRGEVPLLLLDSEGPVTPGRSVWTHLKLVDDWSRPTGAHDDQAFFMVQIMETWLLADREALQRYFGAGFCADALKAWPKLESVAKDTVLKALERASAGCATRYSKGRVSFDLLGQIDPGFVGSACPHACALLDRLRGQPQ